VKIVVFGNTNNYPLRLAIALRELGHDAHLIVNLKGVLHRPESLVPEYRQIYPDWIHDCSDIPEEDYVGPSPRIGKVLSILERADALILNSFGPSLLAFIQRPVISLLTGSDLDYYANFKTISSRKSGWENNFRRSAEALLDCRLWVDFIRRQREGILRSVGVSYFHRGLVPQGDQLLDEIGIDDARRFFVYMCDESKRGRSMLPKENSVLRILCGTRLTWKMPIHAGGSMLDYKGSDVMIKGVALYVQKNSLQFDFRIVEKGMHIAETKQLVHELGLEKHVTWLQEMSINAFQAELDNADVCFEQLSDSVIGMVGLDAMARGKPVIANARPDIWQHHIREKWPVCHAVTPEDVCAQLEILLSDSRVRRKIGQNSMRFVQKYFSPESNARLCLEKLGVF